MAINRASRSLLKFVGKLTTYLLGPQATISVQEPVLSRSAPPPLLSDMPCQTEYDEPTGQTLHTFMVDMDPVDEASCPLG